MWKFDYSKKSLPYTFLNIDNLTKPIFALYNFGVYKAKIVTNSKQKCAIPY